MYPPIELARFALAEFKRNLEGLTDEEARSRLEKANGAKMNAISWTVCHIAGHWLGRPERMERYNFRSNDPTPPTLGEALSALADASSANERWLPEASEELLSSKPESLGGENVGTGIIRATLHTWFHCGEINAIRQQLGHDEIAFLGDITKHLEWRSNGGGGYRPDELVRFAISEFERGMAGVTAEEAVRRLPKADGTAMNSITWTMGHVSTGWLFEYALLSREHVDFGDRIYFGEGADPTPPSLDEMQDMWARATSAILGWLPNVTDDLLSSKRDFGPLADENLGTQLLRAVLHTWFHIGEINAIRQQLGHDEIAYVGTLLGNLEWRSEAPG